MRTLLTGASGFLGTYIQKSFSEGLVTLGRGPENHIQNDLSLEVPTLPQVDLVIHSAGLAHRIPKNPEEERRFYQVNLFGTQNLIMGLERCEYPPKTIVFISTVAVYGIEEGELISELVTPKPVTPYGKSKHEAELLLQNWARSKKVNLLILRLPLIAGGANPPGNLGAMIHAIKRGYYFRVGKGLSKKSMVLASDIANLIPHISDFTGTFNLTDGQHPSLRELDSYISKKFERKVRSLPMGLLNFIGKIGDFLPFFPINSYRLSKLNSSLTFDDSKARKTLSWNPQSVVGNLDL